MAKKNAPSKKAVEALRAFLESNGFDMQFEVSLCLSDLPKTHMSKANNGKIYSDIVVAVRKEPDQWGRDMKVYMKPTKQDRENHANKIYVGGGKMIIFEAESVEQPSDEEIKNLPFGYEDEKKSDLPF